jgi:serine/threonine protein phosphatase 1
MPARLFQMNRPRRAPRAVPEDVRVYAIGDIHGRVDLLSDLHRRIEEDAQRHAKPRMVVVYVGDYVDRGLQSRAVLDVLIDEPLEGFESVHLKGNHEAMMLQFLEDARGASGWLEIGGNATLLSYGVKPKEEQSLLKRLAEAQGLLQRSLPLSHRTFLEGLKLHHVEGDYLFVHAGLKPRVPIEEQRERDLLWIREDFLESSFDHGKTVVHGHSISWEPEIKANRINVDTGAFASGVLTCLVLDGGEQSFLQTKR